MKSSFLLGVALFAIITAFAFSFTPSNNVQWAKCSRYTPQEGRKRSQDDGILLDKLLFSIKEKLGLVSDMQYSPLKHKYISQAIKNQLNFPYTPFSEPEMNIKFDAIFDEMKKSSARSAGKVQKLNITAIDLQLKGLFEKSSSAARAAMPDPHFSAIECAKIQMPLMWEYPNDPSSVQSFVKRFKSKKQPARGRVWLLQGGPGGDSTVFESYAALLMEELDFQYDLYLIDHRGTGRSAPLMCDSTDPDDIKRCVKKYNDRYGSKPQAFKAFGTTYAALDLGHWISVMKNLDGGKDVVYGVSYGTWWLNRLLAQKGNLVDMAVADSVVTPGSFDFLDWDSHYPEVGDELVKLCEADTFCSQKLSVHPKTGEKLGVRAAFDLVFKMAASSQHDKKAGNKCSRIFSPYLLKSWFAVSLSNDELRRIAFPMVFRILRCSDDNGDASFLKNLHFNVRSLDDEQSGKLLNAKLPFADSNTRRNSTVKAEVQGKDEPVYGGIAELLYTNVVCSEISKELSKADPKYYHEKYFLTTPPYFWVNASANLIGMCKGFKEANAGYEESTKNSMANYDKPMLTLQGTLDPQTPYIQSLNWKAHYSRPLPNGVTQQFVVAKNSYHGALFATRTKYYLMPFAGMRLFSKWVLADGLQAADSSLLQSYKDYDIDFSASTLTLSSLSYASDLWDGAPQMDIEDIFTLAVVFVIMFILFLCVVNCCMCCSFCFTFCTIGAIVLIAIVAVIATISTVCCSTGLVGSCSAFSCLAAVCCCGCTFCRFGSRRSKSKGKGDSKFQELQEDEGKLSVNNMDEIGMPVTLTAQVDSIEITPDVDQVADYDTPA